MKWFRNRTEQGPLSRIQRAAVAAELRTKGLTVEQISHRLGVSRSYAYGLLNDPDGSADRERKKRYGGVCRGCGASTDGGNGRAAAPDHCRRCAPRAHRYWTEERVRGAIQRFAAENGRPPMSTEWLEGKHGRHGDGYPFTSTVMGLFGSWANAIEEAGFPRPAVGHKPRGARQRVSDDELIERIRGAAEMVMLAPSIGAMQSTYVTLMRRGISWEEACERAGCRPRRARVKADA